MLYRLGKDSALIAAVVASRYSVADSLTPYGEFLNGLNLRGLLARGHTGSVPVPYREELVVGQP